MAHSSVIIVHSSVIIVHRSVIYDSKYIYTVHRFIHKGYCPLKYLPSVVFDAQQDKHNMVFDTLLQYMYICCNI